MRSEDTFDFIAGAISMLLILAIGLLVIMGIVHLVNRNTVILHRVIERQDLQFPHICRNCSTITNNKDLYFKTTYTHYIDGKLIPKSKLEKALKEVR